MISYLLVNYLQKEVMMTTRRARTQPLMVRGTLFTLRRRCGKPTCHCASGEAHESPALAYPEAGKTKTLTLAADQVGPVRAALERYTRAGVSSTLVPTPGSRPFAARRCNAAGAGGDDRARARRCHRCRR